MVRWVIAYGFWYVVHSLGYRSLYWVDMVIPDLEMGGGVVRSVYDMRCLGVNYYCQDDYSYMVQQGGVVFEVLGECQ